MKIIHETMKTLKKITFGRVLGLIAVLCLCWVSILAVSYTHLDVYKRQSYDMPVNFGETFDVDGSCGISRLYQVEQDAEIIEYKMRVYLHLQRVKA